MVAIRHIETFVTFDFDPSFISRLTTDSDSILTNLNGFLGMNWWMIRLQNCKNEIAEKI